MFPLFGEKSSTPQPLPKKTSKRLFHLYLWYFKQWRPGTEGGVLLRVGNRTSHSASLQHKPSLLFKHPRNGLSRPRDRRLAITKSHSKSRTPVRYQTFSPPCRQHYRRQVKPGGCGSGPTALCCLHCPTPQDGWKVRLRHSDTSYLSPFWLSYVERYHCFWRKADHYSRRHTSHTHSEVTVALHISVQACRSRSPKLGTGTKIAPDST